MNDCKYIQKKINYNIFNNNTFFIEPTDNYDELFLKSSKYSYQHEVRIIIKNKKLKDIFDRFSLIIQPLDKDDYHKNHEEYYIEYMADIKRIK